MRGLLLSPEGPSPAAGLSETVWARPQRCLRDILQPDQLMLSQVSVPKKVTSTIKQLKKEKDCGFQELGLGGVENSSGECLKKTERRANKKKYIVYNYL